MKAIRSTLPAGAPEATPAPLGRRGLVVGAGVAGAAAVAAHALHRAAVDAPLAEAAKSVPEGEGYRLTPHVLRYYETTKA
jgi:2-polyprenyl-6-methoxyphenol hydroxylase-like FAD-dependent oxidoreductase